MALDAEFKPAAYVLRVYFCTKIQFSTSIQLIL